MQKKLLSFVDDVLGKGVVLTLEQSSDILNSIEFKKINSNSYAYNLSEVLPEVDFRELGVQPDESCLQPMLERENLAICYGDISVDRALTSFQNVTDILATNTMASARAMAVKLSETFFYGNSAVNVAEFDGLETRLEKGKGTKITKTLTGAADEIETIEEMIDSVDGRPSVIYCNKKTRRILNKIARANNMYSTVERFGVMVDSFDGIPVVVTEAVKDNHVFAVKYGEQHVQGLTIDGIQAEDLGVQGVFHKAKIEGYVGLMTAHPKCFAMVTPAAAK